MSTVPDQPKLRSGLAAARLSNDSSRFRLWDNRRLTHRVVDLAAHELQWAQLFDGSATLRELQLRTMRQNGGTLVSLESIAELVRKLDDALLLESAQFMSYVMGPVREPSCLGCYDANPERLRKQLDWLFTSEHGPGRPNDKPPIRGTLRAMLVPHVDYARGGVTYGWGFKELFENNTARLFVIIATSHYSPERFTATRQDFLTPLGRVTTDQAYLDRIEREYGDGLFEDLGAHLPEHAVELEVVLLQYLYERHGPIRIVPIVVGSFGDAVRDRAGPQTKEEIARFVSALQRAEAEAGEEVCYIISGDLAHIGPKFDDPEPVHNEQLRHSRGQDERLMASAAAVDAGGYFETIREESDARRICGLPPTWTTLTAAGPSRGRLLHYQQYVHPEGFESVSFASMAFDK